MSTYVYIPRRIFACIKAGMRYAERERRLKCQRVYISLSGCLVDLYFSDNHHASRISTINKTPVNRPVSFAFSLDALDRILKIEKLYELSQLVGNGTLDGIFAVGTKSRTIPTDKLGVGLIDFTLDDVPSAFKRFADKPAARVWMTEPVKMSPEYVALIGSMFDKLGIPVMAFVHAEKRSTSGNYECTFEGFDNFGWQIRTTVIARTVQD